jgi:stringent starvation protein B
MNSETRAREKKERLLQSLEQGVTQVHLDARRPGVLVPAAMKTDPHLVLNLSYRFDPPDLTVSDWGVRETLSFKGERFTVGVPWSALYAIASHVSRQFWMYPDDMPEELLAGAVEKARFPGSEPAPSEGTAAAATAAPLEEAPSPRALLREVAQPPGEGAEGPPAEEKQEPTPPRRGHLRLVK